MTTDETLLVGKARALREAGLSRVTYTVGSRPGFVTSAMTSGGCRAVAALLACAGAGGRDVGGYPDDRRTLWRGL